MDNPEIWNDEGFLSRFRAKIQIGLEDECWPWLGAAIRGRGCLRYKGREFLAPRIAKVIEEKAWPAQGLLACHSCDNPTCVNPKHIWWGTNRENIRDAASKGLLGPQKRTHCRRGHELTEDNYIFSQGIRRCRQCRLIHQKKWRMARVAT
ncbi:HNH endonuclease [Methylobacterium variabile]|jgi:hypothetical protein|uniref:HNH endonuclease n=1 Tax=Methylobacterium variabile TaxID=298794 RepID=UPI0012EDD48C|nr:HNH endonuclease [Methylobacterium variabile]